ncbi:hypothetical protein D3C86_1902350 [compost metagenome]
MDVLVQAIAQIGLTPRVLARYAICTVPARDDRLDRDTVAFPHMPTLRCRGPDALDESHDLVAGHDRHASAPIAEVTEPLLIVGAAQTTGFDPQDRVVVVDLGYGKFTQLEVLR